MHLKIKVIVEKYINLSKGKSDLLENLILSNPSWKVISLPSLLSILFFSADIFCTASPL